MTSKPVPVPSPATQRASSVAEDDFSDVSLRRGEGWRGPLPAWSPEHDAFSQQGRTKQVEHRQCQPKAVKRAYKRACKRAAASQAEHTWYRGQWLSIDALRAQYVNQKSEPKRQATGPFSKPQKARPHNSLVSWNAGGLAANTWDALQNWLHMQGIQICCTQETRWNLVNEWFNGQYNVYHHGTGRSGGLLTMVSTRLATRSCIRTCVLANGRIQHTRIYRQNGSIDVINIYQRVWSRESAETIASQRKTVWNAMRELLDSLPARNQVLVCGDMNTQLPFTRGVTGTSVGQQLYRDARDEHELQSILRLHGTQAVNTFHDPYCYTYIGPGARTQLDYVFMRAVQAGGLAKHARGLHDFPLNASRGECYHVPIYVQFLGHWKVWQQQTPRRGGPSRIALAQHIQTNPAEAKECINVRLQECNGGLDALDTALKLAQADIESKVHQANHQLAKPWQDSGMRGVLQQAWSHLRQSRQQDVATVRGLFQAWQHLHQFQKLMKSTRTQSRRLRRARLLAKLDEAQQADTQHDLGHVYRVVDKIAPKCSQVRPQLRNSQGFLLDTQQETQAIASYLQQVYTGHDTEGM